MEKQFSEENAGRDNGYAPGHTNVSDSGTHKSYNAFVIKPDAIRKGQLEIVMAKIRAGIRDFGQIVATRVLKPITECDVETMYPLLHPDGLQKAKNWLVGGEMIILIIESHLPSAELFSRVSDIKGPRLIDWSAERLRRGRILDGSLRDLLPPPGEEEIYAKVVELILAKREDPTIQFLGEQKALYTFYAQNLVHTPDNERELLGLFQLAGFSPQ
ncbi:MAG TPA: hypothetical protein VNG90_01910 [Candidatus Acidoferrum sp.]|nr:hypothetical protein [Candidatus Acidoferrum sp.]